jgi:hypothetical protein
MPSKGRAQDKSATVDLTGLTTDEIEALGLACLLLDVPEPYPDEGFAALSRVDSARRAGRGNVRNVPRESLTALAGFLRPHQAEAAAIPQLAHFQTAFAKLDERLRAPLGRRAKADEWQRRAEEVARVTRALESRNGIPPTDADIEAGLKIAAGSLRRWRWRKPELFPAPPFRG